jgi:hypothetical protein
MIHLRSLPSQTPRTSTGWVQWMWPEIQAGLETGKKLREVWEAVQKDGMNIPYPQFRCYVSRVRRRQHKQGTPSPKVFLQMECTLTDDTRLRGQADPLYNVRMQLEKKREFHFEYNPFPDPKDGVKK